MTKSHFNTLVDKTVSRLALNSLCNIDQKWQVGFFLAEVECQDFSV